MTTIAAPNTPMGDQPKSISRPSLGSDFGLNCGPIPRKKSLYVVLVWVLLCAVAGCGTSLTFKPPEFPPKDEKYYLLKDIFMTAGSAAYPKAIFDPAMNESVNLVFVPNNEKNEYTAETRWIDPNDQEYKTIRKTYDTKIEGREGMERKKGGTPRIHSMSTKELFNHKPGMWKVALYLDDQLARRLTFTVRK